MSENLTLDPTPTTTIPRRTQSLPVGARFPRTWPSNVQFAADTCPAGPLPSTSIR